MISLNKITVRNFKIFGDEPYIINFEDSNLVLLDGPNGYGKTSVFDAIELGLTGNISRLISLENRQNPADIVVAHKGNDNVEITLEFKDKDSKTRVFQRKLKNSIPNTHKKISKFTELWELNEIVNGELISTPNNILEQYFESKDFSRDFLLFHYVQQEETSRFLKSNNETQRAEELAQLFGNTKEADEKYNKLNEISNKITSTKKEILKRINEIKQLYKIDENSNVLTALTEKHAYLLPWLAEMEKTPFWDLESITDLNQENLNNSLSEITNIKHLFIHQDFFIRNRTFERVIQQRELLELYIGYYNFIPNYELYIAQNKAYDLIKSSYSILKSGDLKLISTISNFETIFQILMLGESTVFEEQLLALITEESKASGLNSIYSELLKHHDAMFAGLQQIPTESNCLLCGHGYHNHDELTTAVTLHGHLLRSELSENDKSLVTARDSFNKVHLSPLLKACTTYLEQTIVMSQEDLNSFSKAYVIKERLGNLNKWLLSAHIKLDDLIRNTFTLQDSISYITEATNILCERIRSSIGNPLESYIEANNGNIFERIYRDYFNNEPDKLSQISIDLINRKENYIRNLYFSSLKQIVNELTELTNRQNLLDVALKDIGNLSTIVRTKIRQYRKKLITDIEIPFYIYSGKILQTHQAGLGHGIFIKDPTGDDELKNVRLVSNWQSDHDILNTMSSGQISAVVIALTLALHRVYANKFSTILIDDPVQTMDDINMSSLVELLRNDFSQKQIILSTHEDKVARYFTYKYLKHKEKVRIVNLMQRKEYIPNPKYRYKKIKND
ncbi:AAA family ATPase [Acinetobacter pittii]|uniref:ATP-binding protein n=2 Tax=Acinetobacter pittii TaxID=48296 RepID=UPI00083838F1|nr:AAA family ATPase [Acinetobacter pittii]OCZ19555.1 chromosome segregation protein SMC [Acinetobacter pittii]